MQRYFIANKNIINDEIVMDEQQWHHITKVMRCRVDDQLYCIDQNGRIYVSEIEDITIPKVRIKEEIKKNYELGVDVILLYGMPKNDKFEMVLQKSTELGVKEIVPLSLQHCQIKDIESIVNKKQNRYQKILQEASEQSYRNKIPILHPLKTIKEIALMEADIKIIAYEEAAKQGEASNLKRQLSKMKPGMKINIMVGPEGGFSKKEVDYLKELGYQSCGLGKRILRSETAPLYLLSVIGYYDELLFNE